MDRVDLALGRLAFRLYDADGKATTPFNSALYDAEMIGFAETSNPAIISGQYNKEHLKKHIAELFAVERFINSVRQATSDELSVNTRIDLFIDQLNKFDDAVQTEAFIG